MCSSAAFETMGKVQLVQDQGRWKSGLTYKTRPVASVMSSSASTAASILHMYISCGSTGCGGSKGRDQGYVQLMHEFGG